jgi:hypothetical protein
MPNDDDYNCGICPLTMKTIIRCNDAMDGSKCENDDPCVCNFILWPLTMVIDIICCPCFYGYFRYNKIKEHSNIGNPINSSNESTQIQK